MQAPTKQKAKGYDIVVWIDDDGDIVTKSYTHAGTLTLKAMVPDYEHGYVAQIHCDPKEFMAEVPHLVTVGMLDFSTKKLVPMRVTRLH